MIRSIVFPLLLLLPAGAVLAEQAANDRGVSFEQFTRGGQLFQQHCAECHGAAAQGAPGWTKRGADGKNPPPPLDGSGHAWHHPAPALARTIREGTIGLGGSMPAWKDTLSDDDVEAIIGWLVSRWPEEAYQAWSRQSHAH